jgi:hypothetical protein
LNFGRAGADTPDHVNTLHDAVLLTEPDFILLQWYVNDVERSDHNGRPRPWRLLPSSFLLRKLEAASALYFLLNQQWLAIQGELGLLRRYEDYMIERFGDPNSPSSRRAHAELVRFIDICKSHRVPVGIVLFGWLFRDHSPLDFLLERVLALCGREELPCLDTRDVVAPYDQGTRLWANRLDAHPGVLAHRLVADALMGAFGEIWLGAR